jgi:glyoxylase-like metal-dependent hydrolase (beta-lactamase superfamily II)
MTDTRHKVALLAGAVALLLPAFAAHAQDVGTAPAAPQATIPVPRAGVEVTQLGPGYYTFRYLGIRNVFLVTSAGVIATDPISPAAAAAMREEIRRITPLPVKYVVYSHEHWDHVLGGRIFREEGARFVAHENCVKHFRDLPNPELVMPDVLVKDEGLDLRLGDRVLRLRYLGPNHGDCLLVMTPDHVNVPFIVDLATPGGMPLPFIPDYSLHNWVRSLQVLEGWDFEQYVGGHGLAPVPKARITERREYVEALMTETRRELDAGTPEAQIPDAVAARLAARFGHLRGFQGIVRDNVRRTITYYGMGW